MSSITTVVAEPPFQEALDGDWDMTYAAYLKYQHETSNKDYFVGVFHNAKRNVTYVATFWGRIGSTHASQWRTRENWGGGHGSAAYNKAINVAERTTKAKARKYDLQYAVAYVDNPETWSLLFEEHHSHAVKGLPAWWRLMIEARTSETEALEMGVAALKATTEGLKVALGLTEAAEKGAEDGKRKKGRFSKVRRRT